ncbi:hypothetical protein KC315_g193 [Hortaea werneckii]|uniref:rRNA-processing protein EFG1 n=1 Tax=Hortaea werneckii TaxID=91943 RepID=A0A3M7DHL2_HORWE|nr:hypothetical protein KC315_g193 [Hortaea werneckii]RMY63573.1 hypothetical protein D0863_10451 [Hortaea werneckii]
MATKRPNPSVHPSRHAQVPEEPRRKKQKPDNLGKKSFKKAHTVNDLKSQVRSLRRMLEHNDDLPPNVRIEKERALRTAQHELDEEQRAKKRSDMIGRWHKIRFFDRQKATKRLKRAKKELQGLESDKERQKAEKKVQDAQVDVDYAIYYPLDLPYKPLFPTNKKNKDGTNETLNSSEEPEDADDKKDAERQGDAEMWAKVKQCAEDGTLDALRNGKLTGEADDESGKLEGPASTMPSKRKRQKEKPETGDLHGNRRERRAAQAAAKEESDQDSEDGFFE